MAVTASGAVLRDGPGGTAEMSPAVAAACAAHRRRRSRDRVLRVVLPILAIAVLLGGWQLSSLWLNPLLFSTPWDVARTFPQIVEAGALQAALSQTMSEWAISLGIGLGGGVLLGALMGRYRWFERTVNPFVDFLIATPRVVLIPLLVVWIGVASEGRIVFAVLTNMFVVVINTIAGVRNVNRNYVDVARSVGLSDRAITLKIRVPGAIPYILAGARLCASVSLVGLIIAELEFSSVGLGYLLQIYQSRGETDRVLVLVVVAAALGLLIVGVFKLIEWLFFGWVRAVGTQGARQ